MVPKYLAPLFWDANLEDFDPSAYPVYTIERVLERGNEEAVAWLRRAFTEEQILDVLRTDRRLSPRSATFWALLFGLPTHEVAALRGER